MWEIIKLSDEKKILEKKVFFLSEMNCHHDDIIGYWCFVNLHYLLSWSYTYFSLVILHISKKIQCLFCSSQFCDWHKISLVQIFAVIVWIANPLYTHFNVAPKGNSYKGIV